MQHIYSVAPFAVHVGFGVVSGAGLGDEGLVRGVGFGQDVGRLVGDIGRLVGVGMREHCIAGLLFSCVCES